MDFLKGVLTVVSGFAMNFLLNGLLFALKFRKRKNFAWRFFPALGIYVLLLFIYPGETKFMNWMQGGFFTYYFVLPFGLLMFLYLLSFRLLFRDALYFALMAWFGENAVSSLSSDIALLCGFPIRSVPHLLIRVGLLIVFELCFYFFLIRRTESFSAEVHPKNMATIVIATFGLITLTLLAQLKTQYPELREKVPALMLYTYSGLLSSVFLCFMYSLFRSWNLKAEKLELEKVIQDQARSYITSKETIDQINIRCHDLSKQLDLINQNGLQEEDKKTIQALKQNIRIYGNLVKTGNEALDLVLARKSLALEQNGVRFSCMADGTLISFMSPLDIYSLFGNALDNAFEAVVKEKEGERLISMRLFSKGGFVYFEMQNNSSLLSSDQKNFETTKDDKERHGYGLKAIRYIAEKYRGSVSIDTSDSLFTLCATLPLMQKQ